MKLKQYKFVDINDIMVLFLDCDTGLVEMDNIIKILVLFGKYHIHKAKCMLNVPNGRLFSIDLKIFYESLTLIQNNRKAVSGPPGQHIHSGGGGAIAFPSQSFFPLLPNQIILFQLLKSFSFVCNGKVIIFRFGFL